MKHPEFLDCKKEDVITRCPICNSGLKMNQPDSGTHITTREYACGTEIDYPIGHDGATYGATCDGEIKRFVMPEISEATRKRFRYKNFFKQGNKLMNTKIEDCEIDEY